MRLRKYPSAAAKIAIPRLASPYSVILRLVREAASRRTALAFASSAADFPLAANLSRALWPRTLREESTFRSSDFAVAFETAERGKATLGCVAGTERT